MSAVRTNTQGEFTVPGLPDKNVRVYVRRPDSRIWERSYKAGPDYVLSPRMDYTVHVLDPSGNPVRNAELALSYHESRFTHRDVDCRKHVRRNPNIAGSFELRRIPSWVGLRLLATAPGFGPGVHTPIKVQPEIRIYLSKAQQLRIRVQGRHAKPLSGADVFVTFRTPPNWEREIQIPGRDYYLLTHKPVRLGRTDKDGWLALENFWQSPMSFEARYAGYAMKKTAWMTPVPNQPITIRMLRAARLQGRLQLDGEPPKQPWVILAMDGELVFDRLGRLIQEKIGTLHRTITAPDGSFFFNEPPRRSLEPARAAIQHCAGECSRR